LLPSSGVGGLVNGADVEVLGTRAGTIGRIVINPEERFYALAEMDNQVRQIISRDSTGIIKRRFGVAGAAYVEIGRGSGLPMDWNYAVIEATTERAPTDSISALIDEAREKIFPILTDFGRIARALAATTERIERGQGNIGRVIADETLMREAEATVAAAHESVNSLDRVLGKLEEAGGAAAALVAAAREGKAGVPALLRQTDQILGDIRGITRDLGRAATRTPAISRSVEESAETVPALLTQTQMTAAQLEKLLVQLRGHWLLGGGSASPDQRRLAPTQARP
jgi:phospholipid/cholesterol/gamma-HCH transport system substrate-binding protein